MEVLKSILLTLLSATSDGVLWGIMAIGVYLTYRVLKISDLTVDGSFALGACISIQAVLLGYNPYLALLIASLGGALAGIVTGLLHTKLKIPAILSSILTMIALYSINLRILGKGNIALNRTDSTIFNVEIFGLSATAISIVIGLLLTVVIVVFLFWFFGTEVGCAIRATGNNENMAKAQGVNTDFMKIIGLAFSNGLVAFSGGLIGQSQRYADVTMGSGTIVIGLAAVVIGGAIIGDRGSFALRLISSTLGSIIYRGLIALALFVGLKTDDQKLATAVLVVIALKIPDIKEYTKRKFKTNKVKGAK